MLAQKLPGHCVDACLYFSLIDHRGHCDSVLIGVTNATRIARQQGNPALAAWCELQSKALKAHDLRSAYSRAEQSLWLTDIDAAALAAAPSACL